MEEKKTTTRVYRGRKKKWVPRLQYLVNRVVVPKYDKKHRLYIEQPIDTKVELYVSKDSFNAKAGIPAKIIGIKDLKDHAYVLLESATFTEPSELQITKFVMGLPDNVNRGSIRKIESALGKVVEINYMTETTNEFKAADHFIIGMAFGTLWRIPYKDYRKYVPKDITLGAVEISFREWVSNWYANHIVQCPTEDQINRFLVDYDKKHPGEVTEDMKNSANWKYYTFNQDDTPHDIVEVGSHLIGIENPCVVPPYRSDIAVETGLKILWEEKY